MDGVGSDFPLGRVEHDVPIVRALRRIADRAVALAEEVVAKQKATVAANYRDIEEVDQAPPHVECES